MSMTFSGKVALVTGGAAGIGRATAQAFAAEGLQVVVSDVDVSGGEGTVQLIRDAGGEAVFVRCDVTRDAEVKALMEQVIASFGRLDYAFNNAGIEIEKGKLADGEESEFDAIMGVNVKGVWLCMKHQIPLMLKQGRGAIVNCSSVAGLVGFPGIPAYVAAKHGIVGLTKAAALELASTSVRVNAVCPGVIQTPMIDRFVHGEAQLRQQLLAGEPVGRIGTPEEVADTVVWLCSDAASFITGASLAIDGGWVAR